MKKRVIQAHHPGDEEDGEASGPIRYYVIHINGAGGEEDGSDAGPSTSSSAKQAKISIRLGKVRPTPARAIQPSPNADKRAKVDSREGEKKRRGGRTKKRYGDVAIITLPTRVHWIKYQNGVPFF